MISVGVISPVAPASMPPSLLLSAAVMIAPLPTFVMPMREVTLVAAMIALTALAKSLIVAATCVPV